MIRGSAGYLRSILILHGLIIRKGNAEGAWEPRSSGWASWCRKVSTPVSSSSLRISSRLGPKTENAEPEKGREDLRDGQSLQKYLQSACLNSLVATEINVPFILCGFLCCGSCHFVKVPFFFSLVCPTLD